MRPLKITATLVNGFSSSDEWSPAIEGILGYQWMVNKLGEEEFALSQGNPGAMSQIDDLPIAKCEHNNIWWYKCSSPIYESGINHQHHFHRRFDQQHTKYLDLKGKTGRIQVAAGPYKNYRRMIINRFVPAVEWHVIGDRNEIWPLLNRITHIGAKPSQGYGEVSEWEIRNGDVNLATTYRPLPIEYCKDHDIATQFTMEWGIRPPGRLPSNQVLCAMPIRTEV